MENNQTKILIDRTLRELKPFFDNKLSTLEEQVKSDRDYVKAICVLRSLNPEPYLDYYDAKVREYDTSRIPNL